MSTPLCTSLCSTAFLYNLPPQKFRGKCYLGQDIIPTNRVCQMQAFPKAFQIGITVLWWAGWPPPTKKNKNQQTQNQIQANKENKTLNTSHSWFNVTWSMWKKSSAPEFCQSGGKQKLEVQVKIWAIGCQRYDFLWLHERMNMPKPCA